MFRFLAKRANWHLPTQNFEHLESEMYIVKDVKSKRYDVIG